MNDSTKDNTNLPPPNRASQRAVEERVVARKVTIVSEYFKDVGLLCFECPHFVQEPEVNFYGCRVLLGDADVDDAPCL